MWKRFKKVVLGALLLLGVLCVVIWWAMRPPSFPQVKASGLVLIDVTTINPLRDRREHQTVTVSGNTIQAIAPSPTTDGPSPYRGMYVLPGLINLHGHMPPDTPLGLIEYAMLLSLAHGVTAMRDAGDADGTSVPGARASLESGEAAGPRHFACGPFIAGGPPRFPNTILLQDPNDADGIVAKLQADGYHCVKSYDDLSLASIRALETAADKYGLPVIGHVPYALAYEEALIRHVQHFLGVPKPETIDRDHLVNRMSDWDSVDEVRMDEIVKVSLAHGIINTPTLAQHYGMTRYLDYDKARATPAAQMMPRMYIDVVWHPRDGLPFYRAMSEKQLNRIQHSFTKKKALAKRLYEAGAELRIGTDVLNSFVVHGASFHQEMRFFNEFGMPPEEVWATATWKAAAHLPVPLLGRLQAGAPADLIIFREDPTTTLDALDTLEAVVVRDQLYTKQQLDAARAKYLKYYNSFIVDRLSNMITRALISRAILRDY